MPPLGPLPPRSANEESKTTSRFLNSLLSGDDVRRPLWLYLLLSICLCTCIGLFVLRSWHWQQVNDPEQISYLCWLMEHGIRPYKDLIEMNMPGIYMTTWTVMHVLGTSSLAWRLFDLGLAAVSGIAMFVIARPFDWFAGLLSAALYILFHAHDGPAQMGQRDYIISVLLLCAYACLFEAQRRNKQWLLFFFGFCASAAATFKPQCLLFAAFLLAVLCWRLRRQGRPVGKAFLISFTGMLLPLLMVLAFLAQEDAILAFVHTMTAMLPYYATLDRRPLLDLLRRSIVPSVGTLLCLGAVVGYAQRKSWNWERTLLLAGIAFGAFSEIAQGKGFIYHRYPLTAFIVLSATIELVLALRKRGWIRTVAYAGILYAAATAVLYTARSTRIYWDEAYNHALAADLTSLGGHTLSGQAQCITMAPDCATTFYRMHLVQSTGLVYDYYLFGDPHYAGVVDSRKRFWEQFLEHRPKVIVLGRWLYPERANDYSKLNHWPKFRDYLNAHYALYADRYFPPALCGIRGYRIYVLRPGV